MADELAPRVATHTVSFLINSLGGFMQERDKTNGQGIQELMAGEQKDSKNNKFFNRFKRK